MTEGQKFLEDIRTGVRRVVINTCHGGFGLSAAAEKMYLKLTGEDKINEYELDRDDPYLVTVVKELGIAANGTYANLKVVEIPGNIEWQIEEYDGREWVAEAHRTWD